MRTKISQLVINRHVALNQIHRSDILGSETSPHVLEMSIPVTSDFKLPPVEVLKKTPTGTWKKAVHGADYDYTYPANDLLKIEFYTAGEFKVNK